MEKIIIHKETIEALKALNTPGDDTDFVAELIQLFFDTTKDLIPQLKNAVNANDLNTIHRISHRLKGSSGNVGAVCLSHICEEMEMASKIKAELNYSHHFLLLEQEYQNAINHLKEFLQNGKFVD
jgi:HPt (histidine-containing phosphotransfer) domain-containing protein